MQFLVVDHCRNHLANLLSRWTSSKILNLALEFHGCNYFRFWRHIDISGGRSLLYLLTETIFHLNPRFVVGILTVLFTVSEIYVFSVSAAVSDCRSSLESSRYTLPASLPWSNAVRSSLIVYASFGYITTSSFSSTRWRPTKPEVSPLESLTPKTWVIPLKFCRYVI